MDDQVLSQILIGLGTCIAAGAWAKNKGYNFFCWCLTGGLIGFITLAFMPDVNKAEDDKKEELAKRGNKVGLWMTGGLFLIGFLVGLSRSSIG